MGVAAMDEFRLSKLQDDVRRPLSRKSHGGSALGFHSLSDKSVARQIQMREGGKGYSEAEEDAFFDLDIIFKDRKASRRQKEATRAAMKPRRLEGTSHREVDTCHIKPGGESKRKRKVFDISPVSRPRRYEDGLPVYKSFEDFSDLYTGKIHQRMGILMASAPSTAGAVSKLHRSFFN